MHQPEFRSAEVAQVLDRDRKQFADLRNSGQPKVRIDATTGSTTQDHRWSRFDSVRMAVVAAVPDLSRQQRWQLFHELSRDPDAIKRVSRGEELWGVFTGGGFMIHYLDDCAVWLRNEGATHAHLIDFSSIVRQATERLDAIADAKLSAAIASLPARLREAVPETLVPFIARLRSEEDEAR